MDQEVRRDIEKLKALHKKTKDEKTREAINKLIYAIIVISHQSEPIEI